MIQLIIKFSIRMSLGIRNFVPMQKLGEGSFASVYKVKRNADSQIYALKKIKISQLAPKVKENALNQVRLLASLQSPFIIRYHQAFFDESTQSLCIVMEYADQGDLRAKIERTKAQKKITAEIQIWKVMIHLLQGLKVLHQNHILHRDLKCENIMISQQSYKIADMNVSIINKHGLVETQTGTPYYASPEVWKDQPYNQQSDIWSIGCILYELANLRPPFTGHSLNQLYKNVLRGSFNPIPKIYSNELSNIISRCLRLNPSERPTVIELLENWTLKLYQNICVDYKVSNQPATVHMLKTIVMPKNLKQLNSFLPKSNYYTQQTQETPSQMYSGVQKTQRQSQSIKKNFEQQVKDNFRQSSKGIVTQQAKPASYTSQSKRKQVAQQRREHLQVTETHIHQIFNKTKEISIHPQCSPQAQVQQKVKNNQNEPLIQANLMLNQQKSEIQPQLKQIELKTKTQSLQQADKETHKNPEDLAVMEQAKDRTSLRSLQEIQSFNRLIQRIKSTSKKTTINKTQKKRRILKEISNKAAPTRSNSKSIKRTERSMSREIKNQLKETEIESKRKPPQSERSNSKGNQNMLKGQIKSQGYRKVLEQAKSVLSRRLLSQRQQFF